MVDFSGATLTEDGKYFRCSNGASFAYIPPGTPQDQWDQWPRESRLFAESGLTPAPASEPAPPSVEEQLASTDRDMARVAEDWIAAISVVSPDALQWIKDNRPGGLAKVNARRKLRGEPAL